uniref:Uncharacterized protein n=1 Tax=Cannabis sativa TaxID=3483 RepID=A0A803QH82_CANSA
MRGGRQRKPVKRKEARAEKEEGRPSDRLLDSGQSQLHGKVIGHWYPHARALHRLLKHNYSNTVRRKRCWDQVKRVGPDTIPTTNSRRVVRCFGQPGLRAHEPRSRTLQSVRVTLQSAEPDPASAEFSRRLFLLRARIGAFAASWATACSLSWLPTHKTQTL